MKKRIGFVSNSSSCSFIIENLTNETKTLEDFARENIHLVDDYLLGYGFLHDEEPSELKEQVIHDAAEEEIIFEPKESVECIFGDEQGTTIGRIYDYILRDGGRSKSFGWRLDEMLR